ncbi:hypothetical protein NUW54_g5587 [Trametes sanguinea]|uniref:Uncharacterized protein n=1 Tax=Trametes sanguinea TaxID=158606 RepID=A0ACC1PUQ7_9APHY|nr:hypothetical protein NUW54_g5587 [Trametes sanguinea]
MSESYRCFSCNSFTANNALGLGQHRKKCRTRAQTLSQSLYKRKAAIEEAVASEVTKRRRLTSAEEIPIPPADPVTPPGRRTRTGRKIRAPKAWQDFIPFDKRDLPSQIADAFPRTPSPPPPVPSEHAERTDTLSETDAQDIGGVGGVSFETPANVFGVYQVYQTLPQREPACQLALEDVCDFPTSTLATPPQEAPASVRWLGQPRTASSQELPHAPFTNGTSFALCTWFNNSATTKSLEDFEALGDILRSDQFKAEDAKDFFPRRELKKLDAHVTESGIFSARDGWREAEVEIPLPKPGACNSRKLLEVIVGEVQDRRFAAKRNWIPHRTYWTPPSQPSSLPTPTVPPLKSASSSDCDHNTPPPPSFGSETSRPPEPIRVLTDTFDTDAMNQADEAIRSQPRIPGDAPELEYAVLPMCLWSDATCLATFGSASLWPIYLYIANISKYIRGKPTEFVAQHLAYIPSLPDELQDSYREAFGQSPSTDTLRWCKSELMQQIWALLLDPEFLEAYQHGIVVECGDGVLRRLFPRFITYSADYPEKYEVLLTAIKNLGKCPCPRCLVPMSKICASGTKPDLVLRRVHQRVDGRALQDDIRRAREWLFTQGLSVTSTHIKRVLDSRSLIPMQNAFSVKIFPIDPSFNFYNLFAPDLMHEFELGVWKGIFTHLLRLLQAQGNNAVQEFDRRMRNMPTFGRDKIRRFWHNVSRQNKLAARDYEDFLITAMPAFEGLLPLHDDQTVADLLFELVNWHALAKLRLHTEVTVDIFRAATSHMYAAVRTFARTTCKSYTTHELKKEAQARARRQSKSFNHGLSQTTEPRVVKFNVWNTYKYHCLGDHPEWISFTGPLETCSTRTGEVEHRHVKRKYARTNKNNYAKQIAKLQRRAVILRGMHTSAHGSRDLKTGKDDHARYPPIYSKSPARRGRPSRKTRRKVRRIARPKEQSVDEDIVGIADPASRYDMGASENAPVPIYDWLAENEGDPAVQQFIPRLYGHIWCRLTGGTSNSLSEDMLDHLEIRGDRLYRHRTARFYYTTYNMQRGQDTINPRTHADVMLLSEGSDSDVDSDSSPYWYARVVGIFHLHARFRGPGATSKMREWQRVDILWARWFEYDTSVPSGFIHRRPPRIQFMDAHNPDVVAFSFIDPSAVLRAAYILPAFHHGLTTDLLEYAGSVGRHETHPDEDWRYYYVGMFVDRDTYMRHLGGGVGHNGIGLDVEHSRRCTVRSKRHDRKARQHHHSHPGMSSPSPSSASSPLLGSLSEASSDDESDTQDLPWARSRGPAGKSAPDAGVADDWSNLADDDDYEYLRDSGDSEYDLDPVYARDDADESAGTRTAAAGEDPGDPEDDIHEHAPVEDSGFGMLEWSYLYAGSDEDIDSATESESDLEYEYPTL